jgi:glycerol transport system ATP-binding protein
VLHGVHEFESGAKLDAALDPDNVFVFDPDGRLVAAPDSTAFSGEVSSGSREVNASKKM